MKKVIIITGASRGIGLQLCKVFSEKGYTVYGGARTPFNVEGVNALTLDITDSLSIKNALKTVIDKEGRLDILINNAGMGISGAVENTSDEEIRQIFEVNLLGADKFSRLAIPFLRKTKGKIINISSPAALFAIPFQAYYSSSKAALNALSLALRQELKPFLVKVCCIMPGDTKSSFVEKRKKNYLENDPIYGTRINSSIQIMERDERNGMEASVVSKRMYKTINRKNPPPLKTIGGSYKLLVFLSRLIPKRLELYLVSKVYDKK